MELVKSILLLHLSLFIVGVVSKPTKLTDHPSDLYNAGRTITRNLGNPWEMSGQYQGDIKLSEGIKGRNVLRDGLWPNGIIPYYIEEGFTEQERVLILNAMATWEGILSPRHINDGSCQIKFVHVNEGQVSDYVYIFKGPDDECWSYIGHSGGEQRLSLGQNCLYMRTILHELGHTLGMAHQHAAHNRDDYVEIVWSNINPNLTHNFEKKRFVDHTDFGLGYDYDSIMHYSSVAFAKRNENGFPVGPTMVSKDQQKELPEYDINRGSLSRIDKLKAELMYCKAATRVNADGSFSRRYALQ
ncbi:astacin-like metalloprotease toxin 5 isoform X1 [Macrosteles quadrilineatus]|uniref:astacin-like metalloprotease toxin 5 isoform X1 n=1 Tax=Macrosteles quadrilineatus TaxID=74068 RepID=UPI0023E147D1|nr:astacin-like metalloprotease toxin 5 isoform X1 [Macrosteles quadrilineatus]